MTAPTQTETGSSEQATGPARSSGRRLAYAFVAPLLAVFVLFYLWPAFNTLVGSFFRWGLLRPWNLFNPSEWDFVGIQNYTDTLTSGRFWNSVVNTGVWLVVFPLLVTVVSLVISVLIWQVPRAGAVFRTAFILPMTISLAAAGVIWTFIYDPDFGVLTRFVEWSGMSFAIEFGPVEFRTARWLSNPGVIDLGFTQIRLINLSLIVAGFWAFTGFGVITFTAGLTAIPDELVEAARVDGATTAQTVRHVITPLLRGTMTIVATISVIFALRTFDVVWVITQGGPAQDSEVLAVLLWKQAFVFLDSPQAGLATAVAIIMSAVLVAGAWPYLRDLARDSR